MKNKANVQRVFSWTAAGSSVPDERHMIVAKETGTCDAGPGIAASCLLTKISQVSDILIAQLFHPTPSEEGTFGLSHVKDRN